MSEPVPKASPLRRLPQWLRDVLLSAVLLASMLMALARFAPAAFTWPAVLVTILTAGLLPWRRRHPLGVLLAVAGLLAVNVVLLGVMVPGSTFGLMVAGYAFAARVDRSLAAGAGAAVVLGIGVLSFLSPVAPYFEPPAMPHLLSVALAVAAGDAARSRREVLEALGERARRAEESRDAEARRRVAEERVRIARDLHDTVAHQISAVNLHAGVAAAALPDRPDDAQESLRTIRASARTVLSEIGDLLSVLRAEPGEALTPQGGLADLERVVEDFERAGLAVTRRVEQPLPVLAAPVDRVAFLVVREALTNAHKHGNGHAHLLVEHLDGELGIVAVNRGSDGPRAAESGFGLIGLRERVESVRGTVAAGPDGGCWRLAVRLPTAKRVP